MIKEIRNNPTALGYCNLNFVYDVNTNLPGLNLQILPIDVNGDGRIDNREKAIKEFDNFRRAVCIGKYPRDLCRTLYVFSREKPTEEASRLFLRWILKDGQQMVEDAGYSKLTSVARDHALKELD